MKRHFSVMAASLLLVLAGLFTPLHAQPAAQPQSIMPLRDVRIGMKGYGLSVFHGTKIEPFPVEVISVMHDFAPNRGVVWIRCPDERMQKSGPVQGMSGSPIYLWADGQEHALGEGGLLIGAFAFGFSTTKDCYVGVQPIELMRAVGERADAQAPKSADNAGGPGPGLHELAALARSYSLKSAWQSRVLADALKPEPTMPAAAMMQGPPGIAGQIVPMRLPLAISSPQLVQFIEPLLASSGLQPMQAPVQMAGKPPVEIDPQAIQLEPGSVLSIPLAFGDMDLSASGTVTDVLPDGRVLAFGHAMFGQGPVALPMATGFVHFVVPSIVTSFKLGGSAAIRGAMVRDENSAVVGSPEGSFTTAPVSIKVHMPGQDVLEYRYQVVHHRTLTPMIAGVVAAQSLSAMQELPPENTLQIKSTLNFEGGRKLEFSSLAVNAQAADVFMSLVPPLSMMAQNPHESVKLESAQVEFEVEPAIRRLTLVGSQIDRSQVAPGDSIDVTLHLQPYGHPPESRTVRVKVPQAIADGQYNLMILDAPSYASYLLANQPHLMLTDSADDVLSLIDEVYGVASSSFYVVLQLPEQGLAVRRQELPMLPSSRRAIIATPTSTTAVPYNQWQVDELPVDAVAEGSGNFTIEVRRKPTR